MRLRSTPLYFSSPVKFLHWLIAALIGAQFYIMTRRDYFPEGAPEKMQYMLWHKSIGITLLLCILALGVFRHLGKRPMMLNSMPRWERIAARISHILLYLLVLLMPIGGYLMSTFSGYDVRFFGYLLPKLVSINQPLADLCYQGHVTSAYVLLGVLGVHILAALKHHFIDKDSILRRMLPNKDD